MRKHVITSDDLNMANPELVGYASMQVIDSLQNHEPRYQVLGLAVGFVTFCRIHKINPQKAMEVADRVLDGASGKRPELRAIESYLREEVPA